MWFDREEMTVQTCPGGPRLFSRYTHSVVEADCVYGYVHPVGRTLNLYLHVLLQQCELRQRHSTRPESHLAKPGRGRDRIVKRRLL